MIGLVQLSCSSEIRGLKTVRVKQDNKPPMVYRSISDYPQHETRIKSQPKFDSKSELQEIAHNASMPVIQQLKHVKAPISKVSILQTHKLTRSDVRKKTICIRKMHSSGEASWANVSILVGSISLYLSCFLIFLPFQTATAMILTMAGLGLLCLGLIAYGIYRQNSGNKEALTETDLYMRRLALRAIITYVFMILFMSFLLYSLSNMWGGELFRGMM